jgi:hypothetical protein
MTVKVPSEAELIQEVAQLLLTYLSPDKAARFWANWQIGQGDYLDWRDEQFADQTVEQLYQAIEAHQAADQTNTE